MDYLIDRPTNLTRWLTSFHRWANQESGKLNKLTKLASKAVNLWLRSLGSFIASVCPTPVLLPGKSHGRRSLVGCSPWGRKELDTTEWLHFDFSLSWIEEGNGNPLQCSCLENPRDGGAWCLTFDFFLLDDIICHCRIMMGERSKIWKTKKKRITVQSAID